MNEGGENGGELPRSGGSESQERDQVKFLESLVSHYESLVEDMNKELVSSRNDMKKHIEKAETNGSVNSGYDLDDFRTELCRRNTFIEYLSEQLKISSKSKSVLKSLWQSTLQQIEAMEIQKANKRPGYTGNAGTSSLAPDFLTKWKLLQTYATGLETRLEKATKENSFYRNKIMEIRLEYETSLKKQAVEKVREIQQAKTSYAKEIEYLRASLEKMGHEHKRLLEKRLQAEREAWEFQENTKLQSIKLNVEQLVFNNEVLITREAELQALILKMESEAHLAKVQPGHFVVHTTPVQCTPAVSTGTQSEPQKFKVVQTDIDYIHPEQFQKLKTSQQQLQIEYQKILSKLQLSESDSLHRRNRLQSRIHQLENLNANLQNQIISLDNHNNRLQKCFKTCNDNSVISETATVLVKPPVAENVVASWKKDCVPNRIRVEDCKRDMKILRLGQEIQRLKDERSKLFEVIEKQKSIASKWKAEFKELAKRSIP